MNETNETARLMAINDRLHNLEHEKELLVKEKEEIFAKLTAKQKEAKEAEQSEQNKQHYLEILLDAMVVGAGGIYAKHGMTAPYTHEYYIVSGGISPVDKSSYEKVTTNDKWWENLPKNLYKYLTEEKGWDDRTFETLKSETDVAFQRLPETYGSPYNTKCYDEHIATGYETNGFGQIIRGLLGGTWNTCTTRRQNDLAVDLIAMKGYCNDFYNGKVPLEVRQGIFARHGIDPNAEGRKYHS